MNRSTVMFVGHSHVSAIDHAVRDFGEQYEFDIYTMNVIVRPNFVNYAAIIDGKRVFNPVLLAEMDEKVPPEAQSLFVAMFGGNAYNAVGIFVENLEYDFFVWGEPCDPNLEQQPAAIVRERILIEALAALEHISLLQCTKNQPMVVLCSPPPIEDNDYILANLGPSLVEMRRGRDVARPFLRKKLFLQHTEIFRTHCEALGIPFIGPPSETVTTNGFLRPQYWGDATHGNAAYGALQIRQVQNIINKIY